MRVFGDILKAKKHVRALQVGDWIEMVIDLESLERDSHAHGSSRIAFWSFCIVKIQCLRVKVASGYMTEPESVAEFHYGKRLAQAQQLSAKPVKLNVGHFACVIQNVGVTVTWLTFGFGRFGCFIWPEICEISLCALHLCTTHVTELLMLDVSASEAPRSGRAVDVVRYLWEEAQWDPVDPVEKIMSQFSEDAVYEDLTREDPAFVGWEAIKKYQEETKENTPSNMRFVLDEMTEGVKACTAIWHVEFNTRLSPRGVTYYELNNEGKVCYVRSAYDISF
ncbi:Hypothetical protein SCF082_LOCUS41210 [Durusdinium trenchii]|uniref:SnoaL-like domain-containing protein n=1 Tax=Durusdinium trenchii TaxID=1381693 RepID=A0ABP0QGV3_9DINO